MGQTLSRSESREVAFRLIFAESQEAAALALALDGKVAPAPELQYIQQVTNTAFTNLPTIDAQISAHLQDWTLDRLRRTDLAVLRLALAEIKLGNVPVPVIIKEAVTIAKKYGEPNSGAFVNGVLANFAE